MTEFSFYATYRDGSKQPLTDTFSYDHLKHDQVVAFTCQVNKKSEPITLILQPGQKLIYRHRGVGQIGSISPEKLKKLEVEPDIYIMGWRQTVNGAPIQSIVYILDYPKNSGYRMIWAGEWNDNHPWFYKPNFRKFEVEIGEQYWDNDQQAWVTKTPEP